MDAEEQQWEKKWVQLNLEELSSTTNFETLTGGLITANLLSFEEVDELERYSEKERFGRASVTHKFYMMLMKKRNWYDILMRLLDEKCQSGAYDILIRGQDPAVRKQMEKAREANAAAGDLATEEPRIVAPVAPTTREPSGSASATTEDPRIVALVPPTRRVSSGSASATTEESEEYDLT